MKLTIEAVFDEPSEADIATALSLLTGSDDSHRIAVILHTERPEFFLQAYGALYLECRDGSPGRHFRAVGVTLDDVRQAFQSYGHDAWNLRFSWERMGPEDGSL